MNDELILRTLAVLAVGVYVALVLRRLIEYVRFTDWRAARAVLAAALLLTAAIVILLNAFLNPVPYHDGAAAIIAFAKGAFIAGGFVLLGEPPA